MPKRAASKFLEQSKIEIIHDDILTTNALRDASVDLIITSPPYNVDIQNNSHDDQTSYADHLKFTARWLAKCFNFV